MNLISDFYTSCYYCYYYSYTREASRYSDKMCLVCLSYYLLGKIRVGGDGRRDAGIPAQEELRIYRMARDVWHDCTNRHETCDDKTDDGAFRKVLRS